MVAAHRNDIAAGAVRFSPTECGGLVGPVDTGPNPLDVVRGDTGGTVVQTQEGEVGQTRTKAERR